MASIQHTGRGYRAQVYVGGQRDSKLFRLKREAEAWAFQREKELRAGKTGGGKTLGDALKRYADEISPTHRGERWEAIRIAAFLADPTFPAAKRLADLVPDDIGAWRDVRLKQVSTSTIRREISLVSSALESARREWRWIDANPVRDVRKPREPEHREVLITLSQTRIMLRTMGYQPGRCRSVGQAVACAFLFALRTGMRAGEICKLKWDDLRDGHLIVTGDEIGAGKTGRRFVPTLHHTERIIETMRGWDEVYVFGLKSATLDALFRKYRARAGLSGFTFHDTRHTAATRLAGRVDVLTLCKIFGWKNPKRAMTYYNPTPSQVRQQLIAGQSRSPESARRR